MKKILFLLLLSVATYGQTYQNPTFGTVTTKTSPTVTTTPHLGTVEANGTISKITPANLPVSTAVTNALELETDVSSGAVSGFTLTNNGNGTVNIASGIAYLKITNDPYAQVIKYPITGVTNLTLTDNANNFVLVDYNSGSPTLTVTTNSSTINTQTNSLAYVIARVGNDLEYLSLVGQNVDPNAKLRIRFLNQEGIRRASGATLGFSSRNLTLTSSVLFSGLISINAVAFNTASPDTFTLAYNNGSTWTRTAGQTQINNTQYNVSGTLTDLNTNDYRTDYVYLLPNNPSKLYVIMGTTSYANLTAAKTAPRPSALPVELQVLGLEVGRLFIQKNSAAIAEAQSTFANDFVGAAVPEHNALTGLQGGTSGEYNHLTNAQITLVNGSEQTANKATDFTTANNTLYPSVQAVKTYADGLVVGLLNDRGSYDASTNLYPSTGGSGTAGAIKKGNLWAISVAGTLGGVSVGIGDWVRALVDTPAQTAANWSVVEGNFGYIPENVANKSDSYTASSSATYASTKAVVDGLATKQNTLTNPITGTGTSGYLAKFSGSTTQAISTFFDNGTNAGLGTATPYNDPGYRSFTVNGTLGGVFASYVNDVLGGYLASNSSQTSLIESRNLSLGFFTNNLERIAITGDGNVGIGTNTPATSPNNTTLGFVNGSIIQGRNSVPQLVFSSNIDGDYYNATYKTNNPAVQLVIDALGGEIVFKRAISGTVGNPVTWIDSGGFSSAGLFKINNLSGTGTRNVVADASGILSTDSTVYAPLASPTFTGTPTAPTATAGTTGNQIATLDFVHQNARPYKVYTALISQTGTDAPTVTILENTLGASITWTRAIAGGYVGTSTGTFVTNKTWFQPISNTYVNDNVRLYNYLVSNNQVRIDTAFTSTLSDGILNNNTVEIRVYNFIFLLLPYSMVRRRKRKLAKWKYQK